MAEGKMITDNLGHTPEDQQFWIPEAYSWITVGNRLYQKHINGQLMPIVVSTEDDRGCPVYRRFAEMIDGKPWAEIEAKYQSMIGIKKGGTTHG